MEKPGAARPAHDSRAVRTPKQQLNGRRAPAPIYVHPHKMAPAPPGNESSDWLVPPRSVTSRPRASPRPGAPAHCAAGGRKARSHCRGAGERPGKAVRKPAKCSFRRRGPRRRGEGEERSSVEREEALHQRPACLPTPIPGLHAPSCPAFSPARQRDPPALVCLCVSLATSGFSLPPLLTSACRARATRFHFPGPFQSRKGQVAGAEGTC